MSRLNGQKEIADMKCCVDLAKPVANVDVAKFGAMLLNLENVAKVKNGANPN